MITAIITTIAIIVTSVIVIGVISAAKIGDSSPEKDREEAERNEQNTRGGVKIPLKSIFAYVPKYNMSF